MIAELFLFCATVVGLVLVDKASILIGIVVFGILTYLCATKCVREGTNSSTDTEYATFYDQYLQGVGRFVHRLLSSPPWYYLYTCVRQILFVVKALKYPINDDVTHETPADTPSTENQLQLCGEDPLAQREIKTIVDCILKEYIRTWYHDKVGENEDFTNDVNCVIQDTLIAFCGEIAQTDREQVLCQALQTYLHFFFHFREALDNTDRDHGALDTCLAKKKELVRNFQMRHWAMKDQMSEWSYLQSIMGTLVDSFGPVELLSCPLLHTIVVEILTQNVMYPLINILTDPDRLNSWIGKLVQNIIKLESETALVIPSPGIDSHVTEVIVPSIFVSEGSSCPATTPELASQTVLEAQETNDTNLFSNSSFSDLENSAIITTHVTDTSCYKISVTSNDTLEHDKYIPTKSGTLPKSFFSERNNLHDEANNAYPVFSPINVRTRSNTSITKNSTDNCDEDDSVDSTVEPSAIKRSKSADYIRQMPSTDSLLPLNSLNHSIRYCNKTNKSFIQLKPEVNSLGDIEVGEEAVEKEVPPLISDVRIIGTQQQEDIGHNIYTLYLIQYNGLFQNVSSESHYPDLVQQEVTIKRRFREFMALQSRLEDNPLMKAQLKGIKGLSKWLATPFTNLDKKNISERKVFLESYLQALCKRDAIIRSPELQEFLAYGGDASIAFVKKPADITVPRIDKLIVRSVKGAIDLFRTALPSTSDAGVAKEPVPYAPEPVIEDSSADTKFQVFLVDHAKRGPDILKHTEHFLKNMDVSSSAESLYDERSPLNSTRSSFRRSSLLQHSHSISNQSGCDCFGTISSSDGLHEDNLLSHLILDLVVQSFPDSSCVSHLLKFVPTSFLQNIVEGKLHEITEEKCARLLHMFHRSLWPDVKPPQKTHYDPKLALALHERISKYVQTLSTTKHLGKILNSALGSRNISHAVEMLISSVQNEEMNRCLLFYAFDVVIQTMCPNEE